MGIVFKKSRADLAATKVKNEAEKMGKGQGDVFGVKLFVETDGGFGGGVKLTGVIANSGAIVNGHFDDGVGSGSVNGTGFAPEK